MPESGGVPARTAMSYPALLWRDIKRRKSEFFIGLLLSLAASCWSVWLQAHDGLLDRTHFWDGIVTAAVPVLSIIAIFALVEVYRAAASLHREAQAEIENLANSTNGSQSNDPTLSERVHILAAQIFSFHNGRSDARLEPVVLPMPPMSPQEWNAASHAARLFSHETIDLYLQRFAPQVTLILKELAKRGVIDAELNAAYLLNSDSLIGIADVAERLNTLTERLPSSEAPAPDVTLEGTFPGPFSLHARGHACEIRTGPIEQDSAVIGTVIEDGRTMRVVMPRYVIEFPVVSALRDGDMVVEPSLFVVSPSDNIRSGWPTGGAEAAMKEFLRNAQTLRSTEIGVPDVNTSSVEEMNEFGRLIRQPIKFNFDVTFWNDAHTDQWKRTEVLVYEPQTGRAFVRHEGSAEFLPQEQRNSVGAVVRVQP